jgi:hypothetical protein
MGNHRRASWRLVFLTYPCPHCDAKAGEPCTTASGRRSDDVHGARTQHGNRCPRCGTVYAQDEEPGTLCARCALLRRLEVERVTIHKRRGQP